MQRLVCCCDSGGTALSSPMAMCWLCCAALLRLMRCKQCCTASVGSQPFHQLCRQSARAAAAACFCSADPNQTVDDISLIVCCCCLCSAPTSCAEAEGRRRPCHSVHRCVPGLLSPPSTGSAYCSFRAVSAPYTVRDRRAVFQLLTAPDSCTAPTFVRGVSACMAWSVSEHALHSHPRRRERHQAGSWVHVPCLQLAVERQSSAAAVGATQAIFHQLLICRTRRRDRLVPHNDR